MREWQLDFNYFEINQFRCVLHYVKEIQVTPLFDISSTRMNQPKIEWKQIMIFSISFRDYPFFWNQREVRKISCKASVNGHIAIYLSSISKTMTNMFANAQLADWYWRNYVLSDESGYVKAMVKEKAHDRRKQGEGFLATFWKQL